MTTDKHEQALALPAEGAKHLRRNIRGPVCSLILHILVLLVILGLPDLTPAPPPLEQAVPVNLVEIGDTTASPPQREKAAIPQEESAPSPIRERPKPVPQVPLAPPLPKPPAPRAALKPRNQPQPPLDDFSAQLKAIAAQQQRSPAKSITDSHNGAGESNRTLGSDAATPGAHATYGVKDVIRVQIERHWNFDPSILGPTPLVVTLHLQLGPNGKVMRAEVVDDPRYSSNPNYRPLADSARRAALVASPLQLPPGWSEESGDMVLSLNPR